MGMDYYIIPDRELDCPNDFPESLSYFFEQLGGYGEGSEVAQVSTLLGVDLSAFQHFTHFEELDEDKADSPYWQDIDAFEAVIDELLRKLAAQPHYYEAVRHRPPDPLGKLNIQQDRFLAALTANDLERAAQLLNGLPKTPGNPYPEDRGYLSGGQLPRDLHVLKQTLAGYRQHGARRIMLIYA
jgi:hypothetical protein